MNDARLPFNPPAGTLDASLWFWRCRAEQCEQTAIKALAALEKSQDECARLLDKALEWRRKAREA
jgi:hypothetical protein